MASSCSWILSSTSPSFTRISSVPSASSKFFACVGRLFPPPTLWCASSFSPPNANLATPASFGKLSGTVGNARIFQTALRYDF